MANLDLKICDTMTTLATSQVLFASLTICDLCCIIAAPLLCYWLLRLWKMQLMHYNTRLLLCFHIAWLLVHVLGRAILHTTDLVIYATFNASVESGCDIMHTRVQCFILRLPFNVGLVVANCSAIFVSIERLIATLYTRSYERGYRSIGHYLLCAQVIVSGCLLCIVYSQTRLDSPPLIYCQTTSTSNYMWSIYPLGFQFLLQILSALLFELSSRKNKEKAHNSLRNGAWQLGTAYLESAFEADSEYICPSPKGRKIRTIRALRAYVYLNATITAAYIIALMIILFTNELYSRPTYYSLIEGFNAIYVYALALPLVLWYHRKDVKHQIRIAIRRDMSTSTNQVFKDLQSCWDSYPVESKTSVVAAKYIDHR